MVGYNIIIVAYGFCRGVQIFGGVFIFRRKNRKVVWYVISLRQSRGAVSRIDAVRVGIAEIIVYNIAAAVKRGRGLRRFRRAARSPRLMRVKNLKIFMNFKTIKEDDFNACTK